MAGYNDYPSLLPAYNRLTEPSFASLAAERNGTAGFQGLGSELGSALFGGAARDARGQQIFDQAAKGEASTQEIMEKARQTRDANVGRAAMVQKYLDAGRPDLAAMARNSPNADSFTQAALRDNQLTSIQNIPEALQRIGYTSEMGRVFGTLAGASGGQNLEGDTKAFGSLATPYGGTPAVGISGTQAAHIFNPDSTKVSEGMIYDEGAPVSQTPNITPVGAANIAEKKAQAASQYAAADEHKALADKARTTATTSDFSPDEGAVLGALTERGISLPAGFRSKAQIHATLQALLARNPGKSPDDIADLVRTGQIDLGATKKETQTAAATSGRVSVAGNELEQFAPLVLQTSAAVPRGSFMPINRLLQTADTQLSDPKLLQLKIGINSMLNAYDMLASRGGTDVAKRAEAHALLESAQSPEALAAGIQMFQKEAAAAQIAAAKAMKGSHSDAPTSLGAGMNLPPAPTKIIGGKTYVNHNGQWYEQ